MIDAKITQKRLFEYNLINPVYELPLSMIQETDNVDGIKEDAITHLFAGVMKGLKRLTPKLLTSEVDDKGKKWIAQMPLIVMTPDEISEILQELHDAQNAIQDAIGIGSTKILESYITKHGAK